MPGSPNLWVQNWTDLKGFAEINMISILCTQAASTFFKVKWWIFLHESLVAKCPRYLTATLLWITLACKHLMHNLFLLLGAIIGVKQSNSSAVFTEFRCWSNYIKMSIWLCSLGLIITASLEMILEEDLFFFEPGLPIYKMEQRKHLEFGHMLGHVLHEEEN